MADGEADPSGPAALRREPHFQTLKRFAVKGADSNLQVIVYIRNRVIAIFPNKEVDAGTMNPGRPSGGARGRRPKRPRLGGVHRGSGS
jgi:hypothetical protein